MYNSKLRLSLEYYPLNDYKCYANVSDYESLPSSLQIWFDSIEEVFHYFRVRDQIDIVPSQGQVQLKVHAIKNNAKVEKAIPIKLEEQTVEESVRSSVIIRKLNEQLDKNKAEFVESGKKWEMKQNRMK